MPDNGRAGIGTNRARQRGFLSAQRTTPLSLHRPARK